MTFRRRISTTERQRIYDDANGICHICETAILPGQAWEVSHPIPLAMGGEDAPDNRAPAHKRPCHSERTRQIDIPAIAKVKRVRARHTGSFRSQHPMQGGRDSGIRKKMNGQVVPR